MVAIVGDSANIASIRLHRSAGFDYIGTLKDVGYKHDGWLSTVIMQRGLGLDELALSKELSPLSFGYARPVHTSNRD